MNFKVNRIKPEHLDEYSKICKARNLAVFYPFAVVFLTVEALLIIFQTVRFGHTIFTFAYFYIYLSSFAFSTFFAFIFSHYRKNPKLSRPSYYDISFIIFLISVSTATGTVELDRGTTTNTMFVAVMFFIVTLVNFKITTLWALLSSSIAVYSYFCIVSPNITYDDKVGLILNYLLLLIMFVPSTIIIHNTRIQNFYQQKEITQTNKTLQRANIRLEQLNTKLEVSSKTDGLTGVLNRTALNAALDYSWQRAILLNDPITAIMIDVDHFKNYNDNYGHIAGDNCLKSVALAIKKSLHRHGDSVYRYGGEEFVVLLEGLDTKGADSVQKRIVKAIADLKIKANENGDLMTVSIGINTENATATESYEKFLDRADIALYYAKNHGRNKVIYYDDIKDEVSSQNKQ